MEISDDDEVVVEKEKVQVEKDMCHVSSDIVRHKK